jgi:hypothetical protein
MANFFEGKQYKIKAYWLLELKHFRFAPATKNSNRRFCAAFSLHVLCSGPAKS